MKAYGVNELREMFLSFFESKDHLRLPSFSLVPQNDKSILLINAGMTPMKPWFTGRAGTAAPAASAPARSVSAPEISKTSARPRATALTSKCSATSPSAITSSTRQSHGAGSSSRASSGSALIRNRLYPSVYDDDDEAWSIWHDEIGIPAETHIPASARRITSGSTAQVPAAPARRYTMTAARNTAAASPTALSAATATDISKSGTTFSRSSTTTATATTPSFHRRISTPAWALSALRAVCQGVDSLFDVDTGHEHHSQGIRDNWRTLRRE